MTAATETVDRGSGAETALEALKAGNRRWRAVTSRHPHEDSARRSELRDGQHPFALVLGCADSRVPPELVFDRGLGDLFTVRSAGQVPDRSILASIAFGVEVLEIPLIVVLGHASCGAVGAAVRAHETGEVPDGPIGHLVERILPVVESAPEGGDDRVDTCVTANARHIAAELRDTPGLRERVAGGTLTVVAACYELKDWKVDFLD